MFRTEPESRAAITLEIASSKLARQKIAFHPLFTVRSRLLTAMFYAVLVVYTVQHRETRGSRRMRGLSQHAMGHKSADRLDARFGCLVPCTTVRCITQAQLMLTNPRDAFRGQSSSPNIVPFHMLGIHSSCAIINLSLRRGAVFPIFDFKIVMTLKSGSEVTQGH